MKKRMTAAVLAGFMLAASVLGACGGGADKDGSSGADKNTGTEGTAENRTSGSGTTAGGTQADSARQENESGRGEGATITFPLKEAARMSMFAVMSGDVELSDNEAFKYVEELTNVKWDVQSAMSTELAEKKSILFSSMDYPDVFYKASLSESEMLKYGKEGILLPLEDLIENYAPNLKAKLDEYEGWDYITSDDGKIYGLPLLQKEDSLGQNPCFINRKWLENLGLEEPGNPEEFYEVLKAFQEKDANGNGNPDDEIPFICTDVTPPSLLLAYFGQYIPGFNSFVEDKTLVYAPTSETYKEFLRFLTRLYQEGLLDKNSFTQKLAQQRALGNSDDVLGAFFEAGAFLTVGRERDRDFIILTPFEKGTYPKTKTIYGGTFAITDKCKTPELAMAWADQFYTEEGSRIAMMGIEGTNYKVNEDGTWEWIMDSEGKMKTNFRLQGTAHHPSAYPEIWFSGMMDVNEKYLTEERNKVLAVCADPLPRYRQTDDETKEIAQIKADIDPAVSQYMAEVATGIKQLDETWDAYVAELNNMGAERLHEMQNRAYLEATK